MKPLILALALVVSACGSKSPTAPPPPPPPQPAQVAGLWTGNLESSNWNTVAVELQLTQAGTAVNGTWASSTVDWNGTITGTVTPDSFSGSFTMSAPNALNVGPRCTGNASVSGPAGGNTFRWTGPGFTGSCTGMPTGFALNMQRR